MFFKQNTLSEEDTVKIVTSVALVSLQRHYRGGAFLSASERSTAANTLIANVLGDCSTFHKSKLMAFADTLVQSVKLNPTFDEFFRNQLFEDNDIRRNDAREELCVLSFTGLLQNKIIAGHTESLWTGSKSLNNLSNEFDEMFDGILDNFADNIYHDLNPQFEKNNIPKNKLPNEMVLGYLLGYVDGILQNEGIMDDESLASLSNLTVAKFFNVKVSMELAMVIPNVKNNVTPNMRLGLRAGMADSEEKQINNNHIPNNLSKIMNS